MKKIDAILADMRAARADTEEKLRRLKTAVDAVLAQYNLPPEYRIAAIAGAELHLAVGDAAMLARIRQILPTLARAINQTESDITEVRCNIQI